MSELGVGPEAGGERRSILIEGYAVAREVDFSAGLDLVKGHVVDLAGDGGLEVRRIGLVTLDDGRQGVLVRCLAAGGADCYRMWLDGRALDCDRDVVDGFLRDRRRGHRGGLGRAQGRRSGDGCSYPRATTVLLTRDEVSQILDVGGGNLSLGVRRLAAMEAGPVPERGRGGRGKQRDGFVSPRAGIEVVKIYLDDAARAALADGGSLTEGIRGRLQRRFPVRGD